MGSHTLSRSLLSLGCSLVLAYCALPLGAQPQMSVTRPDRSAKSPNLRDLPDTPAPPFRDHPPLDLPGRPGRPSGVQNDPALQNTTGPLVNTNPGAGFNGMGANGSAPPDTNIAVGPNHIVEVVNSRYEVFSKAGTVLVAAKSLSSLWTPLGGSCSTANAGDPVVQYDRLADRWVITQLGSLSSPYSECVAVSTTNDPTGSYTLYSYNYSSNLNDYPKVGVWPTATNSAYTFTYNLFANGASFAGGQMCAYDRTAMLAGAASPVSICYTISNDGGFLPVDLDGPTAPLDGTPAYFLTWETSTSLRIYALKPNFATPSASTFTLMPDLTVASFAQACSSCVPQAGTTQTLDTLSDRPMYRLAYRVYSDHASMVTNQSVGSTVVGVRWYELRAPLSPSGSFSVFQQGTYSPDSTYRWMGSAAMDTAGNLAIGYSASSSSLNPSLRYTGRNATDALGTLQAESSILVGSGSQTTGLSRWGDYAALRIDPSDDCTFWFSTEYEPSNGTFNWMTRIGSFKFTNCGSTPTGDFSLSATPTTLNIVKGAGSTSSIGVTATNGYTGSPAMSVSGCPTGATCTVTTPIAAGSSGTLTVTTGTAAAGPYTLSVTGTDGTLTHSVNVTLNVQDFSVSATPSTLSIAKGAGGTSSIGVTAINGYTGSPVMSVSGCPSGATCTVTSPIAAGSSGTLSVSTGTVAAGSYTITVTGTDGTLIRSVNVGLTITASDFSLSATPTTISFIKGAGGTSTISVAAINGYAGSPVMTTPTCPAGLSCSVTPSIAAGSSGTLTVNSSVGGSYTVTVTGTDGTLIHSVNVTVNVQDFSLAANPTALTQDLGASGSSTITVTAIAGFSSLVNLSVGNCPAGLTCTLNSTVNPGSSATLSISGAAVGLYTVTVKGTSGSLINSVNVTVNVQDFSISTNPASLSVAQGGSGTSSISITAVNGFAKSVALTVTGCPSGVTCNANPTSIAPGSSSTLTFTVGTSAGTGTFPVTVTGSEGALSHPTTVNLTITPAFTLGVTPTSLTISKPGSASVTVTMTSSGATGSVALSIPNLPTGVTASFSPSTVSGSGSMTSTLTITAKGNASRTQTNLTISGKGQGGTQTTSLLLTVK